MARLPIVLTAALALALALPAHAQNAPKSLGSFDAWDAFVHVDKGQKTCYMASSPVSMDPKSLKRSDVYMMVAHRMATKVEGEVSLFAGYPFKKDSKVGVRVLGKDFELFTHGDSAWAKDTAGDKALLALMRPGKDMQVIGLTAKDVRTIDAYSLVGFGAALAAINKECLGK